ncbi:hypothetical protein [Nannocystis bainbridge]|uniref:Uncharacterized protein n=1 Tax=Nannocystis bainbridge TaxID=2995303 RepID=A0ABT5DTW9_9BACT|nr:hypothetical protein [Nannocystis bainbridge]MDC0716499.1 hypothetical protein [Nannocystis bainbridge]
MSKGKSIHGCVEGDLTADEDEYPHGLPTEIRPPKLFRDGGFEPRGGLVLAVKTPLGTYGMGGPGFLGIQVGGGRPHEPRWLVVTLWAAAGWATIDGDLVSEEFFECDRIALAAAGRRFRSITTALTGTTLIAADCSDDLLVLVFERDGARQRLEIWRDGRDVPPWRGSGQPRTLGPDESMRDAVVVSESGYLWTADDDDDE